MGTLEELQKLMPAPSTPIESAGDWSHVEYEVGTRLPNDYKAFIGLYGSGVIGELPVWVFNPFAADPPHRLKQQGEGIFGAYRTLRAGGYHLPYPLFPDPGGLLPWGSTGNGDYLQWLTVGEPDQWTVIVWDCAETEFRAFPRHSLTSFLVAAVSGRVEVFPRVFFEGPPRFVQPSAGVG